MKKVKISLFVKSDKINEKGHIAVYYKIQSGFSKTTFSAGVYVAAERWKITDQYRITSVLTEKKIRNTFDCGIADLEVIHSNLVLKNLPFSANTIKEIFLKDDYEDMEDQVLLSDLFKQHYKIFVPMVESGNRAKQTLGKYRTVEKHLKEFMKLNYQIEDIALNELNYCFIDSFDAFLRTVKGISNNPTVKYIQTFRSLITIAIKYDWLAKDPFLLYDKKVKRKDAIFLTKEEIKRIENVELSSERLQIVRDIFILNCYVGYAPVDLFNLKYDNISIGNDGQKWIIMDRQKTGSNSDVPLLPKAETIINKYKTDPYCIKYGCVIPLRSNQKMNQYLKEVAACAKINKNLTMYLARHSFATTVILANGLSMEVLSKMLGHSNLRMTAHYGKIQNLRVGQEMNVLREKMLIDDLDE